MKYLCRFAHVDSKLQMVHLITKLLNNLKLQFRKQNIQEHKQITNIKAVVGGWETII